MKRLLEKILARFNPARYFQNYWGVEVKGGAELDERYRRDPVAVMHRGGLATILSTVTRRREASNLAVIWFSGRAIGCYCSSPRLFDDGYWNGALLPRRKAVKVVIAFADAASSGHPDGFGDALPYDLGRAIRKLCGSKNERQAQGTANLIQAGWDSLVYPKAEQSS